MKYSVVFIFDILGKRICTHLCSDNLGSSLAREVVEELKKECTDDELRPFTGLLSMKEMKSYIQSSIIYIENNTKRKDGIDSMITNQIIHLLKGKLSHLKSQSPG